MAYAQSSRTRALRDGRDRRRGLGPARWMKPVRVVLDTNVLVSALLFHGGPVRWLKAALRSGNAVPLASRQTTTELVCVLDYPKFTLGAADQRDLLDDYLPFCESVAVPAPPPVVPECRDPLDRPFLELALVGGADALVTRDADILVLARLFSVPIVPPAVLRENMQTTLSPGSALPTLS